MKFFYFYAYVFFIHQLSFVQPYFRWMHSQLAVAKTILYLTPQEEPMDKAFKVHSKVALQAEGELFTEPAVKFLVALDRTFEPRRQMLLAARQDAQRRLDSGVASHWRPLTFVLNLRGIVFRLHPDWKTGMSRLQVLQTGRWSSTL